MFADIKAPAVDTFENHRFILNSYTDEIDGLQRGGLQITFNNHRVKPIRSYSCVLILHKDYRLSRNQISEVLADIKADEGGGKRKKISNLKLHGRCQTEYDSRRDMIRCDQCKEWFHPSCLGLSEKVVYEMDESADWFCSETCNVEYKRKTDWKPKRKKKKNLECQNYPPNGLKSMSGENCFVEWEKNLEEYDIPFNFDVTLH